VEEDRLLRRALHHHRRDAEALEVLLALLLLAFLAHRCPDVGVDDVGTCRRLHRIANDLHLRAGLLGALEQVIRRLVAFRTRQRQLEPEAMRRVDPGVGHVVAVADPRVLVLRDVAEVLADRQEVGEDLARVQHVREAVDHRHVSELRELLDVLVREGADHDAVDVPREDARGVSDRLAAAELHVSWREEQRVAAELIGADLEGDAGTRRSLHEDHRQRFSGERLVLVLPLAHALGEVEECVELFSGKVGNGEEVFSHWESSRARRGICLSITSRSLASLVMTRPTEYTSGGLRPRRWP
jgi:hypothetical protein